MEWAGNGEESGFGVCNFQSRGCAVPFSFFGQVLSLHARIYAVMYRMAPVIMSLSRAYHRMIGGVVELVVNATALHFALQRWPKQVLGKVGLGGGGKYELVWTRIMGIRR